MKKVLIIGSECISLMRFRGELLKSFKNYNYDVYACASGKCGHAKDWFIKFGINYIPIRISRAGLNPFSDLMFFCKLLNIIRKTNPDIILAYTIKPVIYGMMASHIFRIKNCYALITGLGYAFIPGKSLKKRLVKIIVWVLYKISLKGVKSIFFQNDDDLTLFKDQKIISNAARTIRVYGSGVDLDYYEFKPISKNNKIINFLLIARLLKDKGIYEYIEAAKMILTKFPKKEIKFSLLGSFDSNPAAITKNEVNEWINEGLINYLGESNDVRPHIEKCSVFVLPSYREGMPRSVLEAMSIGRAIITTTVPGCKDTVISGKNGFLIKMKSAKELSLAMTKFIENDYLIQEMGSYSRKFVSEKFNVHKINSIMLKEIGIVS